MVFRALGPPSGGPIGEKSGPAEATSLLVLEPFLVFLKGKRFPVGVADYRRIALLLAQDATWSRARLRDTLVAVLARSPDDRGRLARYFDQFFPSSDWDERPIRAALAEAERTAAQARRKKAARRPSSKPNSGEDKAQTDPPERPSWYEWYEKNLQRFLPLLGGLILVALTIALGSWALYRHFHPPLPAFCLSPEGSFPMGEHPVGSTTVRPLAVTNCGSEPIPIREVTLHGDEAFRFPETPAPTTLRPGQSLNLPVEFHPQATQAHQATLEIRHGRPEPAHRIALTGSGVPSKPRERTVPDPKEIPLYPATPEGVIAAVRLYLSEGSAPAAPQPPSTTPVSSHADHHLGTWLEAQLGDALV